MTISSLKMQILTKSSAKLKSFVEAVVIDSSPLHLSMISASSPAVQKWMTDLISTEKSISRVERYWVMNGRSMW